MADANKAVAGVQLYATLNMLFNDAMKVAEPVTMPLYQKRTSTGRFETYTWNDFMVGFREWKKGEQRVYRDVATMEYTVSNKDYEMTIEINNNDIEDNQLGQYKDSASQAGERAKTLPDELFMKLLDGGFTTTKVYDGQPWFGTHSILGTSVVNSGTAALDATAFFNAMKTMNSWKIKADDLSEAIPLNTKAKYVLVHGPNLMSAVKDVLSVEFIANGASNKWAGAAEPLQFNFIDDDSWYLFNVGQALKPVVLQERQAVKFQKFTSNDSIELFNRNSWVCGGLWRGTMLPTVPWLAYGSTGTGAS